MLEQDEQEKVKVGDTLIRASGHTTTKYERLLVVRLTKTMIITARKNSEVEFRYRRDGGALTEFANDTLLYPTDELLKETAKQERTRIALSAINSTIMEDLPLAKLEAIVAILKI